MRRFDRVESLFQEREEDLRTLHNSPILIGTLQYYEERNKSNEAGQLLSLNLLNRPQ
jgi:hypothetical protein